VGVEGVEASVATTLRCLPVSGVHREKMVDYKKTTQG
jgi:hypothetical protein